MILFEVEDNNGNKHLSKDYEWDKDNGIPNEEQILEDMEECHCVKGENQIYCDGSCINFDKGKVIRLIMGINVKVI